MPMTLPLPTPSFPLTASRLDPARYRTLFILCSAGLVALTGLLVLGGWLAHIAPLVQIAPSFPAMKPAAALSLLLSAFALIQLCRGQPRQAGLWAAVALFLPTVALIEYATGLDFGIDAILPVTFIPTTVQHPARIAPNTACALIFADLTILACALLRPWLAGSRSLLIVALAGTCVFALGVVPLTSYLGGIESARAWGLYSGMALHTAACLTLLGIGLVTYAWQQQRGLPFWLVLPVAVGFVIVSLAMWQAIRTNEDKRFGTALQGEADYIALRTTDRLTNFFGALDRLGNRWEIAGGTPRRLWDNDASSYLQSFPYLTSVVWVDPAAQPQWVIPATDQPTPPIPPALRGELDSTAANRLSRLASTTMADGRRGFVHIDPLYSDDRFDGWLLATFNLDIVFDHILRGEHGTYDLTVTEDGALVFTNRRAPAADRRGWQRGSDVHMIGHTLHIDLSPNAAMLAARGTALSDLVLGAGLLMSLFATVTILVAFRWRRDAAILRHSEDRLHQIIGLNTALNGRDFDIHGFMKLVVDRLRDLVPADGAMIEMIEADELVFGAVTGTLSILEGARIKLEGSLAGLCVATGQVLVSDDIAHDPRVNAVAAQRVQAQSAVIVPLFQRGRTVGVLGATAGRRAGFTPQHVATMELIAGMVGGALAQEIEIDRRRRMEDELRRLAHIDALTGLPNRALFNDRLSQAILNNQRNGKSMAVIYMDIDHFKSINDNYGHAEGDALLQQFSRRVQTVLRKGDTLARLGGDEFIAIAENLRGPDDAGIVAAKIIAAIETEFQLPNLCLKLGVSLGVAVSNQPERIGSAIVERADEALYEVKRAGRHGFRLVEV